LSFVWIMPTSLVEGIIVGSLASFIPLGARRPMLGTTAQIRPETELPSP
jgi:hypothetical protein